MFAPNTPMTLADVRFTTEVVDEETRRVVICSLAMAPFTPAQASDLNVRSLVFDTGGQPKPAIETIVLRVDLPLQRLAFAMAPDQFDRRIQFTDVAIDPKLRVKIKRDRGDTPVCEAVMKVNFRYPSAEDLLYLANGVTDTHYLTFEPEQGDLLTATPDQPVAPKRRRGGAAVQPGDVLRDGVRAEH